MKIFKSDIKIGGYTIPADFKCLSLEFLNELLQLEFVDRVKLVYKHFTGNELTDTAFSNLINAEFPATANVLSDNLVAIELFDGKTLSYEDYIFNKTNIVTEFYSFLTLITVSYLNVVDTGVIELGDKIKLALPSFEGYICLASYVLSKIGLPILTIGVGGEYFYVDKIDNLLLYNVDYDLVEDYLYYLFEDYDYVIDSSASVSLIPTDDFINENDGLFTVIFAFISPYYDAINVYNCIANARERNANNAIKKLYEETAFEIPNDILNGNIEPTYKYRLSVDFENLIKFL